MQDLFGVASFPDGFRYAAGLLPNAQAEALVREFGKLPFEEFRFQGFAGKRRVVSFGWRYDFNGGGLQKAEEIPSFLLPVRGLAARFAGIPPSDLQHVLLTEYRPGAAIGWHKDRSVFGDVIGISLVAPCQFRFRHKAGDRWLRSSLELEPGSVYLLRGPSRVTWEHSIPAVSQLRYSITFRSLADQSR